MKKFYFFKQVTFLFTIFIAYSSYAQCEWSSISVGISHTLGVKTDGSLWAWGSNYEGQLGDGSNISKTAPVQVGTQNSWSQIAEALYHSLAIRNDGTLWSWGSNGFGMLGDGTTTNKNSPVQVGTDTWIRISAKTYYSLGIKSNGTLWIWGTSDSGVHGTGTSSTFQSSIPLQIGTSSNWAEISAGNGHVLAIKNDGTLWSWGWNGTGALGTNDWTGLPTQVGTSNEWSHISAGPYNSAAIKNNGTLWFWGYNAYGQFGNGQTAGNYYVPTQIGAETNWLDVKTGDAHTIALKTDGTLWSCGKNDFGQLGNGTLINSSTPIQIGNGTNWYRIDAKGAQTMAINNTDNTLSVWGKNDVGQLGNATTVNISTPSIITCITLNIDEFVSVSDFYIYPNPTNDIINIVASRDQLQHIDIYNIYGSKILSKNINQNNYQLDMSGYENGIYLAKLIANNKIKNLKIIKR